MHSHASIARDETAREIYTRAHIPYWNLRKQAEQERLLRKAGIGVRRGGGLRGRVLVALGSALIAAGSWMRQAGAPDWRRDAR